MYVIRESTTSSPHGRPAGAKTPLTSPLLNFTVEIPSSDNRTTPVSIEPAPGTVP